ncbi:MAG TPA: D-2-hydroxyacid dehydrogenase [Thermomicrobiales bacterium]|nr:D-2-hydroxyacid dehydrogenase [Thermomicrobiales bacterium]
MERGTRQLDRIALAGEAPPAMLARLRAAATGIDIELVPDPLAPESLAGAEAAIVWTLPPDVLAAAPRLRWVQARGAGVEHLPLAELAARDIVLTNMSGAHAANIAEHLLAMMLAFARRLPQLVRAQERREWRDTVTHGEVFELGGQTLVLVGMGAIGSELGQRAAALGMRVVGVRRRDDAPSPPWAERVYPVARLNDALALADHVALSLPLTADTRGLFGAARLAALPPGAFVYNVGRGGVIDTAALLDALKQGKLAGAGLDVTEPEPPPPDSPLWAMDNVLITAHTSGATPRYWERASELLIDNIRRFRAGEPLRNVVDLAAGY